MFNAENTIFHQHLLPDEQLKWVGIPQLTLLAYLRSRISGGVVFILIALLVIPFIATKLITVVMLLAIAIPILVIVIIVPAAYLDVRKLRAGKVIQYGITNKRLLIWYQEQLQSLFLNQVPGMAMVKHTDGTGSIQFAYAQPISFFHIADVEAVYQQILVLSDQHP